MHLVTSVCVCVFGPKLAVWDFTTWESPVSVIDCSPIAFNYQKRSLLHQAIEFIQEKKFGSIVLTGWEKGSWKLYYGSCSRGASCTVLSRSWTSQPHMRLKLHTTELSVQQSTMTVLSKCRVCVLWNSSWLVIREVTPWIWVNQSSVQDLLWLNEHGVWLDRYGGVAQWVHPVLLFILLSLGITCTADSVSALWANMIWFTFHYTI